MISGKGCWDSFQNTNPVILCYLTSMSYSHIRPTRVNSLVYWKVGGIPNKIGRKPKASIEFEVRAVEWTQWLCVANLKNRFREHTCAKTWSRKHLTEPAGPGIKIRDKNENQEHFLPVRRWQSYDQWLLDKYWWLSEWIVTFHSCVSGALWWVRPLKIIGHHDDGIWWFGRS